MGFFFLIIIFITQAKPEEMTSDDRRNLGLQFYFLTAFLREKLIFLSGLFSQTAGNDDIPG